ncbi:hypothetical protein HYX17_00275 [Candidatus Woesearchaeota archaeon]|nr:hypothetical protein [Candidatus Woesearchaeota archaeon]
MDNIMRDDNWLNDKMSKVWYSLFPEVEKKNNVIIRFKGKWKNKFGHIKLLKNKDTEIAVNSLFKDLRIPSYIINLTIAHELVHYAHGFNSPHKKLYKHPHKGGVVNKELRRRGYYGLLKLERKWIKEEWSKLYEEIKKD